MDERIEAVQYMQDYIEAHLDGRITAADLAEAARFSPWYAARLFKEQTGLWPAEYIRRLRLTRLALRLRDEGGTVTDAAFALGFGSVDGCQRAFLREFGKNPRVYAESPVPLPLFTPYGVKAREMWKETKQMETIVRNVFLQKIEKPARRCVVKRGVAAGDYWSYCQEVGCDVWGLLVSMKSLCGEPVCLWLPKELQKPGTSEYVQGVEVAADYDGPVPEGFDLIDLPAALYLQFQGEPFAEEDYCEAILAVQKSMERFDPATMGLVWDEKKPRIQLEPIGTRGYIEQRAVRAR